MEKYIKKEQCIAALIANGISEEVADKISDASVTEEVADCIYKYVATSAFFACDEVVDLCISMSTQTIKYPAKDVIFLIRMLVNSGITADKAADFIMSQLERCQKYDELRKLTYAYIRETADTEHKSCITIDAVQDIVSDAFVQIMDAFSAMDVKIQEQRARDDDYAELIMQMSNLQKKLDDKELIIQQLNDEISSFKEKESAEKNVNKVQHEELIDIAKAVKKKKYHITAHLIKACKTGRISTEDAIFFIQNTADEEEFNSIVQMYLEN